MNSSSTFDAFLRSSYREVSRYASLSIAHWHGTVVDAEDLTQEAYARFFDKLGREPGLAAQFATRDDLIRYLKRVVDYRIREIARSSKPERATVSLQSSPAAEYLEEADFIDGFVNANELVEREEWFFASLKKLPPRSGHIMLLRSQGSSIQEIARNLDMSPGAVRVDLSRTIKILQGWLSGEEGGEDQRSSSLVPASDWSTAKGVAEEAELIPLSARLSLAQRAVLQMRLVEHKSYKEIAAELGKSASAVKCQYHRARKSLAREGEEGWTIARLYRLPTELRETARLRLVDGLPYSVIAQKLGLAESTIRARISKARYIDKFGVPRKRGLRRRSGLVSCKHRLPSELYYDSLDRVPKRFRSVMKDFYNKENPLSIKAIARGEGETKHIKSEGTIKKYLRRGYQHLEDYVRRVVDADEVA